MQGETKTSNNCQICLEKCKYKKILCGFCDFIGCRDCVKESILYSTVEPCCPKCKHAWDLEFCTNNLTKTFMTNEYIKHKKELLFDIEKSKIPNTMNHVYNDRRIEEIGEELKEKTKELKHIEAKWLKYKNEIEALKKEKANIGKKKERRVFKKRCPNNNCNGFLTTKYKCYSCEARVCPDCYEIKHFGETKEHVCNPNNVASCKAIKEETRNCPKCAIPIFKISGCDQMWCVECKVAFSWKSGLEVSGVIHNPHFYEWKRDNKESLRNVGEILCGGLPDYQVIQNYIKQAKKTLLLSGNFEKFSNNFGDGSGFYLSLPIFKNSYDQTLFLNFMRQIWHGINHFQNYILDNLRRNVNNQDATLKQRIKFIRNKINEEEFKSYIMRNDRKRQKLLKQLHIYEMFNVTTLETYNDIFHTIVEIKNVKDEKIKNYRYRMGEIPESIIEDLRNSANIACKKIYKNLVRMDEILVYCNKELYKLSKLYNQVVKFILPTFYQSAIKHDDKYFQAWEKIVSEGGWRWKKVSQEKQEKHMEKCQWFLNVDSFERQIRWNVWFPGGCDAIAKTSLEKKMIENGIENKDIVKNLLKY